MRLSAAFLMLASVVSSQATNDYGSVCPSLGGGRPHEILPGYFVEYVCGTLGPNNGSPINGVTNAPDCAQRCRDTIAGCIGSSWDADRNLCFLSGTNRQTAQANTVYMRRVADPLQACLAELAQCRAATPPPPTGPVNYCDGVPENGNNPLIVTEGGRRYRVYCGLLSQSGTNRDQIPNIATSQECVQRCSATTAYRCTQAVWTPSTCYLRSAGEGVVPKQRIQRFTSAQLLPQCIPVASFQSVTSLA